QAVDEGAAAALRGDDPPQNEVVFGGEFVLLQPGLQAGWWFEYSRNIGPRCAIAYGRSVAPGAQRNQQGVDEYVFDSLGFTGKHDNTRRERDFCLVDNDKAAYVQGALHGFIRSLPRVGACGSSGAFGAASRKHCSLWDG